MVDQSLLWVILAAGLATAIAVFLLLALFSAYTRAPEPEVLAHAPWLRFDGSECTGASQSALEIIGVSNTAALGWPQVREAFATRFTDLPKQLPATDTAQTSGPFASRFPDDTAMLHIESDGAQTLLSLKDKTPTTLADKHMMFAQRRQIELREEAINKLVHPTWATSQGKTIWTNKAYRVLEKARKKAFGDDAGVFDFDTLKSLDNTSARVSLTIGFDQNEVHWFDISSVEAGPNIILNCAVNVDSLITAETTQRKFVQTLAKTFAQLSTGLAIFDRNRRLVLFNPALVDLTSLPAHFLSAQPNLQSFFDRLRDNRIMPEPKNYSSWRRQIADLVVQSADGRYQETWRLPNGLTYRIVGRPHPDGAIAILIEDISVEMSLTQRFKGQVEIRDIALQALGDAVVCFENDGSIAFWNDAFVTFLGLPEGTPASNHSLASIIHIWKDRLAPGSVRNTLSARLRNASEQKNSFTLLDGTELAYDLHVQDGNTTIVTLRTSALPAAPPVTKSAALPAV
jgi:PAS domain-containing protein